MNDELSFLSSPSESTNLRKELREKEKQHKKRKIHELNAAILPVVAVAIGGIAGVIANSIIFRESSVAMIDGIFFCVVGSVGGGLVGCIVTIRFDRAMSRIDAFQNSIKPGLCSQYTHPYVVGSTVAWVIAAIASPYLAGLASSLKVEEYVMLVVMELTSLGIAKFLLRAGKTKAGAD